MNILIKNVLHILFNTILVHLIYSITAVSEFLDMLRLNLF